MTIDETSLLKNDQTRTLIDRLRAIGCDKYIELPQIAVMGDTSCGKSSVLSAISGITFPSNSDITTRCPTQLILSESTQFKGTVYLQRYDKTSKKDTPEMSLKSIDEIGGKITELTKLILDEGQNISNDSIVITVQGPGLPNLTLIDLPGFVKSVQDGEDKSMIEIIDSLVDRYLKNSRTVILAIVPANNNVCNASIFEKAKLADPEGDRTIAVVTKLDNVDAGAEAEIIDLLCNRKIFLKLGYHAVKCRGQKDLNTGKTISQGLHDEKQYFETTKHWKDLSHLNVGIESLAKKLTAILKENVSRSLPTILKEISSRADQCKGKITNIGVELETPHERRVAFSNTADLIRHAIKSSITDCQLPRMKKFFDEKSNRFLYQIRENEIEFKNIIKKRKYQKEEKIEYTNTLPEEGETFQVLIDEKWTDVTFTQHYIVGIPYTAFCGIVSDIITKWEEPAFKLLKQYSSNLIRISCNILDEFALSKKLKNSISSILEELLSESIENASSGIKRKVAQELIPYSQNHYLFDVLIKLRHEELFDKLKKVPQGSLTYDSVVSILKGQGIGSDSNEDREAKEMEFAIIAYIKVAMKRYIDDIPMIINVEFLNYFMANLKNRLILTDDNLEKIYKESESVISERLSLETELKILESSIEELKGYD